MEAVISQQFDLSKLKRRQPNMKIEIPVFKFGGWKLMWLDGTAVDRHVDQLAGNHDKYSILLPRLDGYAVSIRWRNKQERWEDDGWYISGNRIPNEVVWFRKDTTFTEVVKAAEAVMIRMVAGLDLKVPDSERFTVTNNYEREQYAQKCMSIWRTGEA